jgi:lipopolysaccharide transport system ATP-binding protein
VSTVIKVENISKQYRLGDVGTGALAHDLNRTWHKLRGKEDPYSKIGEANDRTIKGSSEYVWALQDINFEVKQGDVLGIIGRNGAGKSTLLKILSRTTTPTTGKINIKGRIASLLEVGTGFHPELSGRENIFLNGAILGMTKQEIKSKFDEIVDFAGVERYIDTPVKRYSSGMYVRLAFGVAAHLEPEILIVDEVLAVGDAEFQKKALGKMKDVSERDGRTVLFVSHQMDAIARLCNRIAVMGNGTLKYIGNTDEGINYYLKGNSGTTAKRSWADSIVKPGNEYVRLQEVEVCNMQNEVVETIFTHEQVAVKIVYQSRKKDFKYVHGFNLFNSKGVHILSSHDTEFAKSEQSLGDGLYEATVFIPSNFLSEGLHMISVAIMSYDPFLIHFDEPEVVSFTAVDSDGENITNARGLYGGKIPGLVRPLLKWETKKI